MRNHTENLMGLNLQLKNERHGEVKF